MTHQRIFACAHDCSSVVLEQICKWLCGICLSLIICVCVCVSVLIFSGLLRLSAVQTVVLNDFPPDLYLVASAGQMPGHIHAVTSTLPYLEKKQTSCPSVNLDKHTCSSDEPYEDSPRAPNSVVERNPLTQLLLHF